MKKYTFNLTVKLPDDVANTLSLHKLTKRLKDGVVATVGGPASYVSIKPAAESEKVDTHPTKEDQQ